MAGLNPGRLDILLSIESAATQDQDGTWQPYKTDWTEVGTLWANMDSRPGRNAFQAGRRENVGDVQFLVRMEDLLIVADIRSVQNGISNMRCSYVDTGKTYSYTITDATEAPQYGHHRMAIISATKTNSQ